MGLGKAGNCLTARGTGCCQGVSPYVRWEHESWRPEEQHHVHLLYVLCACVLWRGEAEPLRILKPQSFLKPTARGNGWWVFCFLKHCDQNGFTARHLTETKETTKMAEYKHPEVLVSTD